LEVRLRHAVFLLGATRSIFGKKCAYPYTKQFAMLSDDFKIPKYTANEDEVLLLAERVTEAKRISRKVFP
jgi:hypothetical protein